jgi:hypothetical protein
MSKRVRPRRVLVTTAFVAAAITLGLPWCAYWLGLLGVVGNPSPATEVATPHDQLAVWKEAQGMGEPVVVPLNPYTYLNVAVQPHSDRPGLIVAWWVAREHMLKNQRMRGMGWWHLSGAALTIWLTRNWTSEQLLTKVAIQKRANAS